VWGCEQSKQISVPPTTLDLTIIKFFMSEASLCLWRCDSGAIFAVLFFVKISAHHTRETTLEKLQRKDREAGN
jgi:hypothetical protein